MSVPLRICMVTTFFPPHSFGGDAVFVERLAGELVSRGHHVEVIHCVDSYRLLGGRKVAEKRSDEAHIGPVVHGLRSRLGWLSPFLTQQTGRPFVKRARIDSVLTRGFDVIHFHNVSLVGGPGVLSMGSAVKLYTMHECWLVCPTHVLQSYDQKPCEKRRCMRCMLSHRRPPQLWRYTGMLERALRHVDAVIAPSRVSADGPRAHFPEMPVVIIPNFAPLPDRSSRQGDNAWTKKPYFLFVGRLEDIKGLHTVIPLFKASASLRLKVAGVGDGEEKLRRQAAGAGNIEFLGFRSGPELDDLYRRAAAVIVPSLVQEIFPLVILESLRHGTPVVVRRLGGMPEIVEESGGGFVFSTSDELRSVLTRILEDPTERNDRGASGLTAFMARWTPQAHLDRYLELIHGLREERSDGPSPGYLAASSTRPAQPSIFWIRGWIPFRFDAGRSVSCDGVGQRLRGGSERERCIDARLCGLGSLD